MASISAASIVRLHTVFAASAFLSALVVGCFLHFHKIVKNSVATYPDEWFPSVSATIGDWYPERNIFQIFIALTSGPRFALVFLQYYLHHNPDSSLPSLVFISGIVRTLSCGGWVYITSSDDHDVHDVMMILYTVCNIPWMLLGIYTTPVSSITVRRRRKLVAGLFFATILPLVYFFIQHKVHHIPGAYTRYAFFEWGLIFFDVLYDSISEREFKDANLHIGLSTTTNATITPTPTGPIPMHLEHSSVPEAERNGGKTNSKSHLRVDEATSDAVSTSPNAPHEQAPLGPWRQSLLFVSDVYLSYVFWSLFTALIPTLFYFSVWKLGIAGHELALLSVLSPLLLSLKAPYYYIFSASATSSRESEPPTLLSFVSTHSGQTMLHLASLTGMAAYLVPSPGGRLLLVATANAIAILRQVVTWAGLITGEEDIGYQAIVLGLGVIVSSVTKQANRTNKPVWPFINYKSCGYNKTGLVLALIAIYEYSTRHSPAPPQRIRLKTSTKSSSNVFLSALPLGASLFCLNNLLSESSTLIAWSWTGYENLLPRGPVPHLHGSSTIVAMTMGLLLASFHPSSSRVRSWVSSPWWFFFGAGDAYMVYSYRNWTGFAGGLGLAVFLVSILPLVFESAARAIGPIRVAKGYTYAFFVYCLLNLASIFTVAYAFVPGGTYLRERSDLVTIAQMACLLPAFRLPISFLGLATSKPASLPSSNNRSNSYRYYYTRSLLALLLLLSLLTTFYRVPLTPPQPFKSGTRIFNTGIWTVHFGIDNEGHDSQQGMARVIKDMELDIVGLLETDLHRTAFGHRDLTRYMVEELNYNVDIGPGPNSHTWGAALLTKFPIISTKHHLLPSPQGELAPAIEAVLDIYGTEVLVIVAHNGQEEDVLDRELQSTALARIMAASERPVIFLGYVVTKPWMSRPHPYGIMVNEGNVFDIDFEDNDRWCEYIFYRGLYRTSYARVSRGIITDTETQIGQFVLPRHGHKVTNDTQQARYLRSRKEELPVEHWFPMEYYGDAHQGGVNGHYYHVFNTPLYYKIPEGAIV